MFLIHSMIKSEGKVLTHNHYKSKMASRLLLKVKIIGVCHLEKYINKLKIRNMNFKNKLRIEKN